MKARSAARYAPGQLYEVRVRSCASCGPLRRVYCPGLSGEPEVSGVAEDAVSDSSVSIGIGMKLLPERLSRPFLMRRAGLADVLPNRCLPVFVVKSGIWPSVTALC